MSDAERGKHRGFRRFMLKYQYGVLAASVLVGFLWVGIYKLLLASWLLSHICLLIAIVSFVPAALVILVHLREAGPFIWWDKSNVVLTTRRSVRVEKVELIVMTALWTLIFGFVVLVMFLFSR